MCPQQLQAHDMTSGCLQASAQEAEAVEGAEVVASVALAVAPCLAPISCLSAPDNSMSPVAREQDDGFGGFGGGAMSGSNLMPVGPRR